MPSTQTVKCPGCGAFLEYDPNAGRMTCPYCGHQMDAADVPEQAPEAHYMGYHCQSCGAQIVTGETTAATRCYYCHSPVTLVDRVAGAFRPDSVVPFALDEKAAKEKLETFLGKKRFLDRRFFSQDQRDQVYGIYYPYWIGDFDTEVSFTGKGSKTTTIPGPRDTTYITEHYMINRDGAFQARGIVRKALSANDRKLSDGIFPYQMDDEMPFTPGYLSGFFAQTRDVEEDDASEDMLKEVKTLAASALQDVPVGNVHGATTMRPRKQFLRYLMLPTWVITYRGDENTRNGKQPFFFMINGQTGSVCGKLPIHWPRLIGFSAICGAAVSALLCLGGMFLW